MTEMETAKALDRMMAACSRREHCRKEILAKLEKLEVPSAEAEKIVAKLCKEKYIDELRYASAFARDKSSLQGWGAMRIRTGLRMKGIEEETIRAALDEIDEAKAGARLESLLRAKLRSIKDTDETTRKQKLLRYGLSRGYTFDQILSCYDNIRTN